MKKINLGILGGGQLGCMLCMAAKKLRISTTVFTDDKDGPAQNFCDYFIYGKYDDKIKTLTSSSTKTPFGSIPVVDTFNIIGIFLVTLFAFYLAPMIF